MKCFLNCSNNPYQNLISNHLECLNRLIDEHSNSFDNFVFIGDFNIYTNDNSINFCDLNFIGDFNVYTNHNSMINFCDLNGLRNLISVPTSRKKFDNPTSFDLILTNGPAYFQHSTIFETGLSDFHLLTITEFKTIFQKREIKLFNTVITKTLTTISLDLKYWSATLITLIGEHLKKLFLIYSINMRLLKKSMSPLMRHLLWPMSFTKQLWKGLD